MHAPPGRDHMVVSRSMRNAVANEPFLGAALSAIGGGPPSIPRGLRRTAADSSCVMAIADYRPIRRVTGVTRGTGTDDRDSVENG